MQVFQTCGVPPSLGRISLPIIGCTRKRIKALTKSVAAYNGRAKGIPPWWRGRSYETTARPADSNAFLTNWTQNGETLAQGSGIRGQNSGVRARASRRRTSPQRIVP